MHTPASIFLGKAPFLKLLPPLIAGIILQWYCPLSLHVSVAACSIAAIVSFSFRFLPAYLRFRLKGIQALMIALGLLFMGLILTTVNDVRFKPDWLGHRFKQGLEVGVTLLENPVEKNRSYKAIAAINHLVSNNNSIPASGQLILYFKKDSIIKQLHAGDRLLFNKPPQEISNSGNPGSFDYKRYALFNGTTHQVYLTANDFVQLPHRQKFSFDLWLYNTRNTILGILKKYIHGPRELGLAEALLIGYRDDLDKQLLQSYSDTGVVHVIAVSGMHLGLVYWLLTLAAGPLLKYRSTKKLYTLVVLSTLWLFTLLTGGAASIVRAAVMFTCMLLGKQINRNASIYNTLAASAFLLLCYNPYWLWDIGFQLSYTAVLGIVIFYKPIYNLIFINNKLLNSVWQLCAVSIAAQLLTTPIAAYQFHQFPVYFLITNILVVPLSSLVLIGELLLVVAAPFPAVAAFTGAILSKAIWWMNAIIENLGQYPFALWKGIRISTFQVVLLYIFITAIAVWLLQQKRNGLWLAMLSLCVIMTCRVLSFHNAEKQKKLIVYNISRAGAIDFIDGREHYLHSDSVTMADPALQKNIFQPSAVLYRLQQIHNPSYKNNRSFIFQKQSVLLVNGPAETIDVRGKVALAVLSGNPRLYIADLIQRVQPAQIVIDGSVPAWKARYWQKDCDSLRIPCHNVALKGAFVMNL
ncbi:MAG: ComEC family competence protein [Niabella sp.]|nr:ComEC family competence protein [Niabella sp.]